MPFIIENISPDKLKISAPAKINLFLEVLNKRPDGFHNLNSLFQSVSLYDNLTFELTECPEVQLELKNDATMPLNQTNLITRAWEAVRACSPHNRGVRVQIEKNIPIAAGLGGGSSDAAASIVAANELMDLKLSSEQMAAIGLKIGSDIPFFFGSGQALVSGRGEIIDNCQYPTDYHLVLVTPNLAISTAEAYASLQIGLTKHREPYRLKHRSTTRALIEELKLSINDFEKINFLSYPVLVRIKNSLLSIGASMVRMSGSGPTMFGIFLEPPDLTGGVLNNEDDWSINAAQPVTQFNND